MLKYKILALDHDDTVVKSTAEVHYPAFLETLKALRPEISMSLETFNEYCFSPGFFPLCRCCIQCQIQQVFQFLILQLLTLHYLTHIPCLYTFP